ncbi:hypothetical protein DVH24_020566 [Malus domestica]|uniref:DNA2/NAM7 helicase helicase domain-containing protein n=1 Tax=Malus domestica TaxID=3750 RepID=A0A498JCL5_MALDO|nr:hypothetical protein DVH24_020566 [Malus domestica]
MLHTTRTEYGFIKDLPNKKGYYSNALVGLSEIKSLQLRDGETTVKKEGVAGRSLIDLVFFWSLRDVLSRDLYKHQVMKIWEILPLSDIPTLAKSLDTIFRAIQRSNYGVAAARPLINIVFSCSLEDILNAHIYRNQVTKIPVTFSTVTSYMKSFIPSLVEETHADLLSSMMNLSQAPTLEILTVKTSKNHGPPKESFYDVTCVGTYVPQVGDLIALTDIKPKCVDHLNGPRISYLIAYVHQSRDILPSKNIDTGRYAHIKSKTDTLFAVHLMNMTTTVHVWKALNSKGANTSLTKNLLQPQANSSQNSCSICFDNEKCYLSATFRAMCSDLNDSQKAAVLNCISLSKCNHCNTIKLIWGPAGTGKTKTVGMSLFAMVKLKCRTLTCAPTNIAVLEVTARVLRLVNQSLDYGKYGLGDIILFGNEERMKIHDHDDLVDVFLDYRTKILAECFAPLSGWKHRLASMIDLLEDPND